MCAIYWWSAFSPCWPAAAWAAWWGISWQMARLIPAVPMLFRLQPRAPHPPLLQRQSLRLVSSAALLPPHTAAASPRSALTRSSLTLVRILIVCSVSGLLLSACLSTGSMPPTATAIRPTPAECQQKCNEPPARGWSRVQWELQVFRWGAECKALHDECVAELSK